MRRPELALLVLAVALFLPACGHKETGSATPASRSNCERLNVGCVIVSSGQRKNRLIAAGGRHKGLVATRAPGPPPTVTGYEDEDAELRALVAALRRARAADTAWAEMAVLVRLNAQLPAIEGRGGGKADVAQGGGSKPDGIDDALAAVRSTVAAR